MENLYKDELWEAFELLCKAYPDTRVELHTERCKSGVLQFWAVVHTDEFHCKSRETPLTAVSGLIAEHKPLTHAAIVQKKINSLRQEISKLEAEVDPLIGQMALAKLNQEENAK